MDQKKTTLKDLAECCGLAATTVSRILRGKSTYCSAKKIALVKQLAADLHYQPNIGYQIMTGRDTNIAAVLFSQQRITQDDQINRLYMQLTTKLDERNFALYTAILDGDPGIQLNKLKALDARGCRFYIFIGTPSCYRQLYDLLENAGRRCIGFNSLDLPRGVTTDQARAYLHYHDMSAAEGRTNFRLVVSDRFLKHQLLPQLSAEQRQILLACHLSHPVLEPASTPSHDRFYALGHDIMRQELARNPGLQAMAFPSDFHVFGAARAMLEAGLPPNSVRLFGMGDAVASRFAGIPFTTARFAMEACADMLVEHLATDEPWKTTLAPEFIAYGGSA